MSVAHNHPSGTWKPSQVDRQLTRKIVEAGMILDIPLLDHLILTEKSYYFFRDEGDL
ncbi:JAB domain-containing protein [Sphingobacterium oryzagri]|uniref:JAB domain-containing protein n=1 Tax=Sphingobacterium oryzagri TaxID=3025669 RepID=A0ABY7WEX4_9SPHI|nr:JAB domain-containing protein [Sphingobacterium sp. KACC 22765]WDF67076.1 JAB domain-containing protein [Sphingobacterium sp. KACC 22765]